MRVRVTSKSREIYADLPDSFTINTLSDPEGFQLMHRWRMRTPSGFSAGCLECRTPKLEKSVAGGEEEKVRRKNPNTDRLRKSVLEAVSTRLQCTTGLGALGNAKVDGLPPR